MQILCILALVCFLPSMVSANIYGYQDETGTHHFTNIKPANKQFTIVIETKDPQRGLVQSLGRPWQSDEERHSLIRQAKGLLGTPYKLGGEGLAGIDCSAFVKKMFSAFDVLLPRTAREQYDTGRKITRDQLSMGDLVFFKTKQHEPHPTHVGIFMGNDQFIHASALNKGGVRIDSLSSEFYDRRFSGATRIKPLPEGNGIAIITASK
jgi:cell wall-associated NlpC family hydrolase